MKVPIRNHMIITSHVVKDKLRYVYIDILLEAIDKEWSTTSSMAKLSRLKEDVIEINHG